MYKKQKKVTKFKLLYFRFSGASFWHRQELSVKKKFAADEINGESNNEAKKKHPDLDFSTLDSVVASAFGTAKKWV